jgi:hypothetical protein
VNDEQKLRERLEAIEVPASRVQLESLLPAARKQVFRRNAGRAALGAALTVGALVAVPVVVLRPSAAPLPAGPAPAMKPTSSAPPPPVACRVIALPVPAGFDEVTAAAVDPTGRYIVGNGTEGQDFRPILWAGGKPQAIPVTADSVQATDVNSAGTVVGLLSDKGRDDRVFRYERGKMTELGLPKGKWHPYPEPDINTAGDILINAEPSGNSGGKDNIVLFWKAGSVDPIELPLPKNASAQALLDDGSVAGGLYRGSGADSAWVWDYAGKGTKLKIPAGRQGVAYGISGEWVTGGIWPPGSAALWNLRTGKLVEVEGDQNPGMAVNAAGWVVDGTGRLLRDGTAVELPVTDRKHTASMVRDIADSGLAVGQSIIERDKRKDLELLDAGKNIPAAPQFPRAWQC